MTSRVVSVRDAGARAGNLAMISLTSLFCGFHMSSLADILGMSLTNFRRIHRMMGWMSLFFEVVHALVVIHGDPSFLLDMHIAKYSVS